MGGPSINPTPQQPRIPDSVLRQLGLDPATFAQEYAGIGGSSGGVSTAGDGPRVYWSAGKPVTAYGGKPKRGRAGVGPTTMPGLDVTKSVDEAILHMRWLHDDDPKRFFEIGNQMVKQGWLKAGYGAEDVMAVWEHAVQQASQSYQNGAGRAITPGDYLELWAPTKGGQYSDLAGSQIGPERTTSTNVQRSISSRSQIKGATRDPSIHTLLGRDLTDEELDRLVTKVQAAQSSGPTIQTTTSKTDDEGNSTTSTTARGGVDVGTVIEDQLRDNPDYAEHQAAAFYLPLLMQAIGSTV